MAGRNETVMRQLRARAFELKDSDLSMSAIARALGVGRKSVAKWLSRDAADNKKRRGRPPWHMKLTAAKVLYIANREYEPRKANREPDSYPNHKTGEIIRLLNWSNIWPPNAYALNRLLRRLGWRWIQYPDGMVIKGSRFGWHVPYGRLEPDDPLILRLLNK